MGIVAWKLGKITTNYVDIVADYMEKYGASLVLLCLLLIILGIPVALILFLVYTVFISAGFWSAFSTLLIGIFALSLLFE